MSAQLLQSVLDKLTDAEIRALAAAAGIELPEVAPAPKPQRDETMRAQALALGVTVAADPAVSDDAVRVHLKAKLATLGLSLADTPKPEPKSKGKDKSETVGRAYQWVAPTTGRTKDLPKGGILHNWYQKGDDHWTWVRTSVAPTKAQVTALEAAGFVWSVRRAAWYAKRPVGLKTVQKLLK